jgi:hypothetical protein
MCNSPAHDRCRARADRPEAQSRHRADRDAGRSLPRQLPNGAQFWAKPWAPLDVIREAERMAYAWSLGEHGKRRLPF